MSEPAATRPDTLQVLHSSDLHLGSDLRPEGMKPLESVLAAAARERAELLILAGDIFDHNRVPLALIDRAARLIGDAPLPVLILPGNHDCLTVNSVYRRGGLADPANVYVLGISDEELEFAALGLHVWGRPHRDYGDMSPLVDPPTRRSQWEIAVAHGHWARGPEDEHRSWRIYEDDIAGSGADYVALGHWDRAVRAGNGEVPAFYSGSPQFARTANLVRFTRDLPLSVERVPVE